MKKHLPWCLAIALFPLLSGCGADLSGPEFKTWVEDPAHGLRQEVRIQGHVFELQYEPAAYRVLRNAHGAPLEGKEFQQGLAQEQGQDHFTLTVSREDGQPLLAPGHLPSQMADTRKEYLAFQAEKDLHLLVEGAKVPPSSYHFEDDMGLRPGVTLLFSFPEMKKDQGMTVKFHDRQFTGTEVKFTLAPEALEALPTLRVAFASATGIQHNKPQHTEKI